MTSKQRFFRLDSSTGCLYVNARIDRESLCEQETTCCTADPHDCRLTTMVVNSNRSPHNRMIFIEVIVNIVDINDNQPGWRSKIINIEIPEHTPISNQLSLQSAVDPDQGPVNTTVRYELVDGRTPNENLDNSYFSLRAEELGSEPNEPKQFKIFLQINKELDREIKSNYKVKIMAIDGGNPSKSGFVTINITLTDINDQVPYFNRPSPEITVPEDLSLNTTIYKFEAIDPDPRDHGNLEFKLGSSTQHSVRKLFAINPATGVVYLIGQLDYEKFSKPYKIPVTVSDGSHITETILTVHVENVNDNPPKIEFPSYMLYEKNKLRIPEITKQNEIVTTFVVTDPDERSLTASGNHQAGSSGSAGFRCQTNNRLFRVVPLSNGESSLFKLITLFSFDREQMDHYLVNVKCFDNGKPERSTTETLTITLVDINDSPPNFTRPYYNSNIKEGAPIGTEVIKVSAIDADLPENTILRYRLDDISEYSFQINSKTGVITTKTIFDREKTKKLNITVTVTDYLTNFQKEQEKYNRHIYAPVLNNNPEQLINSATTIVIVNIEDTNDCQPHFNQSSYEFNVKEGERSHYHIGRVSAIDLDTNENNNKITYSIKSFNSFSKLFEITQSGDIYTRSSGIDRETTPVISFSVVATDHGIPSLSATADVLIHVLDINDHAPSWVFPRSNCEQISFIGGRLWANQTVNISQEAAVGFRITQIQAVDLDEGPRGEIVYTILNGNGQGYFDLDSRSGELFLSRSLPRDSINRHRLFLKVSDRGVPPKSSTCALEVNVLSDSMYRTLTSRYMEKDLLMMVAMIVVTLVISIVLVATLILLKWQSCRRYLTKHPGMSRTEYPDGRSSPTLSELQPSHQVMLCHSPTGDIFMSRGSPRNSFSLDNVGVNMENRPNPCQHVMTTDRSSASMGGYYTIETSALMNQGRCSGNMAKNQTLPGKYHQSDITSVDSGRESTAGMSQTISGKAVSDSQRNQSASLMRFASSNYLIGGKSSPHFFSKSIDSYRAPQSDTKPNQLSSVALKFNTLRGTFGDNGSLIGCESQRPPPLNSKPLSVSWVDEGKEREDQYSMKEHHNCSQNHQTLDDSYQRLALSSSKADPLTQQGSIRSTSEIPSSISGAYMTTPSSNYSTSTMEDPKVPHSESSSTLPRGVTMDALSSRATYTPLLGQNRPATPNIYSKQPVSFV